jgi:hypothetical protein
MTDSEALQQLVTERERLLQALCAALGIISLLVQVLWRVVRERNCSRELLLREQQSHMQRQSELLKASIETHNETLRVVLQAFASAQPTTLDDLLTQAEHDWNLRSSKTPSGP